MRCGIALVLTALAISALASAAFANDSTAELTTGGLVLSKSADIEMRSEELAVSEKEISVRYRFFNHAANDQTVTVAFPMPDVTLDGADWNIAFPAPDSENFLDFHTVVDGREVEMQYEQKALLHGVDISSRLKAYGVPRRPARRSTRCRARPRTNSSRSASGRLTTTMPARVGRTMSYRAGRSNRRSTGSRFFPPDARSSSNTDIPRASAKPSARCSAPATSSPHGCMSMRPAIASIRNSWPA